MNIRTIALTVSAPRDTVFNFLADIENLPQWAGAWCERLALERGRWWALTAEGEQVVDMETSAGTGVIDLRTGPSPERLTPVPIRVVALSPRRTLVSFIVIASPEQTEEAFTLRHDRWLTAARGLLRRFSGGELHMAEPAAEYLALGLN
ncbi:MAG: hypothetical protein PSU94_17995 [Lacunisphaera sp.]|nr:hypothetical protein [Lacunisphaera sp.]